MITAGDHHLLMQQLDRARVVQIEPRIVYQGQSVFWKDCPRCKESRPHIHCEGYSECAVCGFQSIRWGSEVHHE